MPLGNATRWVSHDEEPGFTPLIPVFLTQGAYHHVVEHTSSDLELEVGGILVGSRSKDAGSGQQFIVVEAGLPARFTRQGSVYLTFTQDSLVDLNNEVDDHYPGKKIVGWYHTHPGMGIFLSPYDVWLHYHFFPDPWQVALVIDPSSSSGGFFIRQADGVLDSGRYFGFYELDGDSELSIVRWNNLQKESEPADNIGDNSYE